MNNDGHDISLDHARRSDSSRLKMNGKPVFIIPAKTIINFDSGFKEKLLCDGPTFTAGNACPYSCSFCYVGAQMVWQYQPKGFSTQHGVTGDHMDIVVRRANPVELARKQLESHSEASRHRHKVIYASPLTDVAANMELLKETVEICKVILELTNWQIRLLSKSNLLPKVAQELEKWDLENPTRKSFRPAARIIYGVSTGTLDDKLAAAFEEGTPKVSKRIESLHWLQDHGFRTFGMICPSLPQACFPGHEQIDSYVEFSRKITEAIRVDKCEHVWAEVINLRGESFKRTRDALLAVGLIDEAALLALVSHDQQEWERYARLTFAAHCRFVPPEKLRFLQYVNAAHVDYWKKLEPSGAVLLGTSIHKNES